MFLRKRSSYEKNLTYIENNVNKLFYRRSSRLSLELLMKSVTTHYDFYRTQLLKSSVLSTEAEIVC